MFVLSSVLADEDRTDHRQFCPTSRRVGEDPRRASSIAVQIRLGQTFRGRHSQASVSSSSRTARSTTSRRTRMAGYPLKWGSGEAAVLLGQQGFLHSQIRHPHAQDRPGRCTVAEGGQVTLRSGRSSRSPCPGPAIRAGRRPMIVPPSRAGPSRSAVRPASPPSVSLGSGRRVNQATPGHVVDLTGDAGIEAPPPAGGAVRWSGRGSPG